MQYFAAASWAQGMGRSLSLVVVSEIGDKTFLLAAIMAMRHSRTTIFSGAMIAQCVMVVASALLGLILPVFLPRRHTTAGAAVLFLFFGIANFREGLSLSANSNAQTEIAEIEKEVRSREEKVYEHNKPHTGISGLHLAEEGLASPRLDVFTEQDYFMSLRNKMSSVLDPVFIRIFAATCLAEWGDRSQISIIALATTYNLYIVMIGAALGHAVCLVMAVMGGHWLANRISIKHVTLSSAVLCFAFGIAYAYEAAAMYG